MTSAARSNGHSSMPGVELAQRDQLELDRGDDAEVAAAAAQRPEQVGRSRGGRRARGVPSAVTTSIGQHAVGGEAVAAAEPAEAAAERVADDADVGRRAGERRRGRPRTRAPVTSIHWAPASTRAMRCVASISTPRISWCLTQDRVVERAERRGVVAGALQRDAQAVAAGEVDERLRRRRRCAGSATSAGRWSTARFHAWRRGVPRLVAGEDDGAGDGGAEESDVGVERAG